MILTSILMITDENCSDLHLLLWSFLSLSLFFINIFTLNILRRTSTWQRTSSQSCGESSVLLSASSTAPRYEEPLDLEQLNVQIFQHQWMPEEVQETWMHAVETFFLKKSVRISSRSSAGGVRRAERFSSVFALITNLVLIKAAVMWQILLRFPFPLPAPLCPRFFSPWAEM